jgi:hypothetical protein
VPPFFITTFTVLRPSAKSCASTAAAHDQSDLADWPGSATPMAKPSSSYGRKNSPRPTKPAAGIGLALAIMPRHQPVQRGVEKEAQGRDRQQAARV